MKLKPSLLVVVVILCIIGLFAAFFVSSDTRGALFSRTIDVVTEVGQEGEEPRPVVESLDDLEPEMPNTVDMKERIAELQKELLETNNDPDKAFELRRRIQLLQQSSEAPTSTQPTSL